MKPLAGYIGYNNEWRDLAQVISRVSLLGIKTVNIDFGVQSFLYF